MLVNKPILIIFAAIYLFVLSGIMFYDVFSSFIIDFDSALNMIFGLTYLFIIGSFYIIIGIGILTNKKWARITSIIIFTWTGLNSFSTLLYGFNSQNIDFIYLLGYFIKLVSSGIGLYAMIFNQLVKNYFNR